MPDQFILKGENAPEAQSIQYPLTGTAGGIGMNFGRLLTAMVTPFDEQMQIDWQQVKVLAHHLADSGSDGLVVSGTTGESPNLSVEEKLQLFSAVKKEIGENRTVIAGTGSNNTRNTIKLTQEAEKIGVDGAMLVVPYYNKPSQEGLYQHFKAVAESTSLPLILYNIPGRSAINLCPQTIARLAEIDNIVAVKEASGNLSQIIELKSLVPSDFMIYSGDDALTLPILSVGGSGLISVASHVLGTQLHELIDLYFAGKVEKAAELNAYLYRALRTMFITSNPVPVKTALNMCGISVGSVRLPLVPADEQQKAVIRQCLVDYGVLNN